MDKIEFRSLYADELYDSFIKVLSWDPDKKFTDYNEDEFEQYNLYGDPYGMYIENVLIGYGIIACLGKQNSRKIAYIISTDYRNKGYGKILLSHLLIKLKEYHNTEIATLVIYEDNVASIVLAQKNGFNKVDEKNNRLIYEKSLKDV